MPDSKELTAQSDNEIAPIVIIGTGPAGICALRLLIDDSPTRKIVIYGNEPWEPYSREKLSSFLAGKLDLKDLVHENAIPFRRNITYHHNCAITEIDRKQRLVIDTHGRSQIYSQLIIATGSRPHLPNIRGIHLSGVLQFRDLDDAQKLMARRARSRRTIVLGGGVLGIETACAMSRLNTEVYIVDHSNRLMSEQIDYEAGEMLKERLLGMGIRVCLNTSIKEIKGDANVNGVVLRNDIHIKCDTVIVTAGVRANVELARSAHLHIRKGIRVDDNMQTSDKFIYAIGDCADHRVTNYGHVTPAYEQAGVVCLAINGKGTKYQGSVPETQLNVNGVSVFSMGSVDDERTVTKLHFTQYQDYSRGIYRKLVLQRGRLIGVVCIGEWDQLYRVKQAVHNKRYLWPWQIKRFCRHGRLWKEETANKAGRVCVHKTRQAHRVRETQCKYIDYTSLGGNQY